MRLLLLLAPVVVATVGTAGDARQAAGCSPSPDWVIGTAVISSRLGVMDVDAAADRAYVTNAASSRITVIDTASLATVATWRIDLEPTSLAVGGDPPRVYVAQRQAPQSALLVLRGDTGQVEHSLALDMVVESLAVDPAGTRAFAVGWHAPSLRHESANGAIDAVDGASGQVVASQRFRGLFSRYRDIAVAPDGTQVFAAWVGRYGKGGLDAFDGQHLGLSGWLSPPGDNTFTGLAVDGSGRRLFLSTTWKLVQIVDMDLPLQRPRIPVNGALVLGQIDAGRPAGIAYDESTGILYATRWPLDSADTSSRELVVIDTRTSQVLGTVPIGPGRHAVALDAATHRIFVTNSDDGTVTFVQGLVDPPGCQPARIPVP